MMLFFFFLCGCYFFFFFFFSSRRRHTRSYDDWSSDVCSSDLGGRRRGVADKEDLPCAGAFRRVQGLHASRGRDGRKRPAPDMPCGVDEFEAELGARVGQIGRASCRERGGWVEGKWRAEMTRGP